MKRLVTMLVAIVALGLVAASSALAAAPNPWKSISMDPHPWKNTALPQPWKSVAMPNPWKEIGAPTYATKPSDVRQVRRPANTSWGGGGKA